MREEGGGIDTEKDEEEDEDEEDVVVVIVIVPEESGTSVFCFLMAGSGEVGYALPGERGIVI